MVEAEEEDVDAMEEEDVVRSSLTNIAGPMDSAPTHQRNAETELMAIKKMHQLQTAWVDLPGTCDEVGPKKKLN